MAWAVVLSFSCIKNFFSFFSSNSLNEMEFLLVPLPKPESKTFGNCEDVSTAFYYIYLLLHFLSSSSKYLAGGQVATNPKHSSLPGRHLEGVLFFLL